MDNAGYVRGAPLNDRGMANRNTMVQIEDMVKLFGRGDWLKLIGRVESGMTSETEDP